MLKHATISRTSRAQQTLQLQRHWQHQDLKQPLGRNQGNDDERVDSTKLDGKTAAIATECEQPKVQQVDCLPSGHQDQRQPNNCSGGSLMDDDVPPPMQEPTTSHNESPVSSLLPLSNHQRLILQPATSSSCCSSPTPSASNINNNSLQFTTAPGHHLNTSTNTNYYLSPAKSRSTPSSLTNSPMKLLADNTTCSTGSYRRGSSRSSRFSTIGATTSSLTRKLSLASAAPTQHQYNPTQTPTSQDSMIKIFAQTLGQEVEYITLHVNAQTKSQQIIKTLLRKFRLKHRDPNLFHLTLERWIRKDGLKFKSVMLLGDEACPLQLQQCCSNPPHNDIKFTLQMRSGALVKIYCSDVVPDANYKCLSLSTQTTVEETIELLLYCLNLASQSTTTTTTTTKHNSTATSNNTSTTIDAHHRQFSGSPSSASSSSSSSETSSSSGIESEPNNHRSSSISRKHGVGCALDSDSRASSVTSISSSSNISSLSSSLIDQYCLVIECKDSNYKRMLHPDEYLVDVYQSLLAEAGKILQSNHHDGFEPDSDSGASSLTNHSSNSTGLLSPAKQRLGLDNNNSPPMKQQSPDQWFLIKLKRRCDATPAAAENQQVAAINHFVNPRQNMPLPPIPPSLFKRQQLVDDNNNNNLRQFVSTTQIEVSRPGSSLATTSSSTAGRDSAAAESAESELMREIMRSTPITLSSSSSQHYCSPHLADNDGRAGASTTRDLVDGPPPSIILLTPPVRPRRRNLSNASSTFGRPLTANNRRRYDPAQLAQDLDRLNISAAVAEGVSPVAELQQG